jgi:amino acid transporter
VPLDTAESRSVVTSAAVTTRPRTLTSFRIVVLIVAALTPLSVSVGTLPLGLGLGGPTTTLMYVAVGLLLALFCVGYIQMVRRITRPGAFYIFISRGLGRPIGVGASFITLVGYVTCLISLFCVTAAVNREILMMTFGIDLPWQVHLFIAMTVVVALALRRIDFNAKALAVVLTIEMLMLAAIALGIVFKLGPATAFPLAVVSPEVFNYGTWSVAFVFAILCFQGFEAGALYAPEAKRPERTIPRGLIGALVVLVLSFVGISWALTGAIGITNLQDVALKDLAGFTFNITHEYLGPVGVWLLSIITFFAQLACNLAFTNFIARYVATLADETLLPRPLGRQNRFASPAGAIWGLIVVNVVVIIGASVFGVDPYAEISPIGFGLGAISVCVLQILMSLAVVAFFQHSAREHRHWWKTTLAPALSAVAMCVALIVQLNSFNYITGSEAVWMSYLPWAVPIAAAVGIGYALFVKRTHPTVYADLAMGDTPEAAAGLRDARDQNERSITSVS